MPNIGLPEAEMRSIIHSACKEPTKGSRLMDQIVATLSADDIADIDTDDHECSIVNVQFSIKKLPQGIRESIAAVGPRLAMPIVTAICPCIGALATGVRLDVHGTRRGLNLISYIAGDFASGKGSIDPVVEAWMSETAALDAMCGAAQLFAAGERMARGGDAVAPHAGGAAAPYAGLTLALGDIGHFDKRGGSVLWQGIAEDAECERLVRLQAILADCLSPIRTRSRRFAPKFCPAKVPMALPTAVPKSSSIPCRREAAL
jgi:hypothetical protein